MNKKQVVTFDLNLSKGYACLQQLVVISKFPNLNTVQSIHVLICGLVWISITYTLQDYFTGTNRACFHYNDVIMGAMASQITSPTVVYSTVYSGADQRKHQRSASLAFVRGIHRWPVNSPRKWPVTRNMFPFDDVIVLFPL